jgi:hypothetical protein
VSADVVSPEAYAAAFIFTGTIERTGAATMTPLPIDERTAIVSVDDVVQAPPGMRSFAGRQVTVGLLAPLAAGRYVFFADLWAVGKGIAVRERAHADASAQTARVPIAAALEDVTVKALTARAQEATLIAVGTLGEVRQLTSLQPRPKGVPWALATLTVEQVVKGPAGTRAVPVVGPRYASKFLVTAPPLRLGVRAIFLLRQPPPDALAVVPAPDRASARFVAASADIQPVERLASLVSIVTGKPTRSLE